MGNCIFANISVPAFPGRYTFRLDDRHALLLRALHLPEFQTETVIQVKIKEVGLCRSTSYKYRQNSKPVSVLSCHLSSQPTPRKRTSSPFVLADAPVYMVLLVLVPSPPYVAIRRRELLPRGFTLTLAGGLFSVTAFIRLLPSVLSTAGYSAQSGLSSPEGATSHSTYIFILKIFYLNTLSPCDIPLSGGTSALLGPGLKT